MILTHDEFKVRLQERFGESENEDDIRLLEDLVDTFENFDADGPAAELADMKEKYSALQKKYRDRFFETGSDEPELTDPEPEEPVKTYRFDELFERE